MERVHRTTLFGLAPTLATNARTRVESKWNDDRYNDESQALLGSESGGLTLPEASSCTLYGVRICRRGGGDDQSAVPHISNRR